MTVYIITEEQLSKTTFTKGSNSHKVREEIWKEVRSTPYNPQAEREIPSCKVPEGALLKLCDCGNDTFRFVETADWIVELELWEGDELLKICTKCGKKVTCVSDMKNGKSISRKTLIELRQGKDGDY